MLLGRAFRPATVRTWHQQQQHSRRWLAQHLGRDASALSLANRSPAALSLAHRRRATPTTTSLVLRRWETSTTGDDKSGHIAAQPGEGILFLDNVFPLRLGTLLAWRPWRSSADYDDKDISRLLKRFTTPTTTSPEGTPPSDLPAPTPPPPQSSSSSLSSWYASLRTSLASAVDPVSLVKRAIPGDLPLTVTEIVPRLKDGGVFIKFRHPGDAPPDEIEAHLSKTLTAHPVRPWFNPLWGCMRAGLVRGVPWLEDLASRVPSSRVRVEFCAPPSSTDGGGVGDATGSANLELSQETLYSLFRRYGKIAEISSQPFESKTLPRYAIIDFMRVRDAVMARSCLHGYVVQGTTRLRLSYEARVKAHHIWDWLTSHPRIVIPILAALLATITVAVFDPIRAFFIRAHVQHSLDLRDSKLYRLAERLWSRVWAYARNTYDDAADRIGIGGGRGGARVASARGQDALMTHRRDLLEALRTWLLETTETFIVVQGPRGSGKKELVVDQALRGRRDVLVIDCKPIVEAHGESATIKKLANAIGYRPVFSWANNLSSLVDLAVQGTTGLKSGFSATLEEQLAKILQTAQGALREVSLSGRSKNDVDAHLSEDAYLEAHPERRVVIVLDNFGTRNEDATGLVYDKIAEWAASLIAGNIAHVVCLTSDTSYPKALVKAMPDRVFRQVALGDLSPQVAMNYVLSHLAEKEEDDSNNLSDTDQQPADTEKQGGEGAAAAEDAQKQPAAADKQPEQKQPSILEKVGQQLPFLKKDEKDDKDSKGGKDGQDGKDDKDEKGSTSTGSKDAKISEESSDESEDGSTSTTVADKAATTDSSAAPTPTGDANQQFARSHPEVIRELESCIGVLGGRLTDLESLVRRLKSGQRPERAVSEIVEQSASEIIKMFLLAPAKAAAASSSSSSSSGSGSSSGAAVSAPATPRPWSAEQAWYLVREIAAQGTLKYNEVLLSDTFSSSSAADGIAAIDALAAAELVTVRSVRGRPSTIRAGSPVYAAAFERLREDRALAARLDRCVLAERVALEGKTVSKAESELALLGGLPKQPHQASDRVAYLLNKLQASQAKIVAYEAEMARLKAVMAEE